MRSVTDRARSATSCQNPDKKSGGRHRHSARAQGRRHLRLQPRGSHRDVALASRASTTHRGGGVSRATARGDSRTSLGRFPRWSRLHSTFHVGVARYRAKDNAPVKHPYPSLPVWRGWHGFRRGLATNLNRLGVQDKTIQAILPHSNLATTMNVYVQTVERTQSRQCERSKP
jgi:integrase